MSAAHLIWICPLCGMVGFMVAAVLAAGKEKNHE